MAVGDDATSEDYPLVPGSGEDGRVRYGAREINRTRDFVAQVKKLILTTWPIDRGGTGSTTKWGARENLGISAGLANPSGGQDGDIYFKIL